MTEPKRMHKSEFVMALKDYARNDTRPSSIMVELAATLACHIDAMAIPYGDSDFWYVNQHIRGIIGHSANDLRTLDPSPLLAENIRHILYDVTRDKVAAEQACSFLQADGHAINARFMLFADEVYDHGGLYKKIREESSRTMTHKFGQTNLRSYIMGGGIMLTFARLNDEGESRATFICDDDDRHGITGGMTKQEADFVTIISMIDEVRNLWSTESENYTGTNSSIPFVV